MKIKEMKLFKEYTEINKELLDDIQKHDLKHFEISGIPFDGWEEAKTNVVVNLNRIVKSKGRHILYFKEDGGDIDFGINTGNLKIRDRKLIAYKE